MKEDLIDNRQIRVFISSTFQDMQDERDELMKKTFPVLRRKAAERDVMLTELDLRWGITLEESDNGKVVEICLKEIENSIPFFIGIVGNRYGWIPKKEDLEEGVFKRFSVVNNYVERRLSVTEMEMQFGVLERPEEMHAFFFIKKGDIKNSDEPKKLSALKEAIIKNNRYPISYYSSVEELSRQVETAFSQLLDSLFPEGNLTELEKQRISQRSFMNMLSTTYVKDNVAFDTLDRFASDSDSRFLIITGESGLGKSALIANWLKESALRMKDCNVVYHFVGNGGSIGNHLDIMKCLVNEICCIYDIPRIPGASDERELDRIFGIVAVADKPLIIVIDAINQIQDINDAKLLNWMPYPPKSIKIIYSTLVEDRTMEVFRNRDYPLFILSALDRSRRITLVEDYLKTFAKKLDFHQVERIVDAPLSQNTLVLKTILNELINYGVFERLDERLSYYLSVSSIREFYQLVLNCYEEDFGHDLVRRLLSLIAVSRTGLSEPEILEITGIKPLYWSRIFCSFSSHLNEKGNLISFSHSYIREAVEEKYISASPEYEHQCRTEIISYFINYDSERAMLELPYQFDKDNDNEGLFKYMCNPKILEFWVDYNVVDFGRYWRKLREDKAASYDVDSYLSFLEFTEDKVQFYKNIIDLCSVLSDVSKSKEYCRWLLDYIEAYHLTAAPVIYRTIGSNLGQPYYLDFAKKSLELCLEKYGEKHAETIESYGFLGGAYYDLTVAHNSEEYGKLAFEAWEKQNQLSIDCYGELSASVASSYRDMGLMCPDHKRGLEYGLKSIRIAISVFGEHHPQVGWAYNHTGCVYRDLKEYEMALDCFRKSFDCWYPAYREYHHLVAASLNNQGHALIALGKTEEGLALFFRALNIRKTVYGESHDYANSLCSIGSCYYLMGQYEKALEYHRKAFSIFSNEGTRPNYTALSHANLCKTLTALGQFEEAIMHGKKSVEMTICQVGEEDTLTQERKRILAAACKGMENIDNSI